MRSAFERELSVIVRSSEGATQRHPIMRSAMASAVDSLGQRRPTGKGPVLPAEQREDVIEKASRLLCAYFFCAFECQNEGSLAAHSAAGMLNSGRTAKILPCGPAAESFASASVRVFAPVTTNRTPS